MIDGQTAHRSDTTSGAFARFLEDGLTVLSPVDTHGAGFVAYCDEGSPSNHSECAVDVCAWLEDEPGRGLSWTLDGHYTGRICRDHSATIGVESRRCDGGIVHVGAESLDKGLHMA